jgi:catechol 2,3-dioxygenase-like lactoylglutathione lyase family enzyme
MSNPTVTSYAHHVTLTVHDVNRSKQFYLDLFNFQFVTDFGPRRGAPGLVRNEPEPSRGIKHDAHPIATWPISSKLQFGPGR